ncbi:MAG: type II toxin-antitoxin system RelE/ParE family toxin [Chthoniobacterales bacterium]
MKPAAFASAAHAELQAAAVYYEREQRGLGRRFAIAVEETVTRVCRQPSVYRIVEADIRKCRVRRFPYAVIFREQTDSIQVLAVMHLHRQPGYWRERA